MAWEKETRPSIYFDYAATTPLDKRVWEAMAAFFMEDFGNPSSFHHLGQRAEAALAKARLRIASEIGGDEDEIIFTSGTSEANNLALQGVALARKELNGADRLLVSAAEHPSVRRAAEHLAKHFNFRLEIIPLDRYGRVKPEDVGNRLGEDVALVSVIYASNEVGTINPVRQIAEICRDAGVPFHSDAAQAMAHLGISVRQDGVDLLSFGAHKFYGPKGIGALYVRKGTPLLPLVLGGEQEAGRRAGTESVPLAVGMARALEIIRADLDEEGERLARLRDRLIAGVLRDVPGAVLTGDPQGRLPNHASFVFPGVDSNMLLMLLDSEGFACSSSSACKVGDVEPSEVLLAMGIEPSLAKGALRVTLGRGSDELSIDALLGKLPAIIEQARALSFTESYVV